MVKKNPIQCREKRSTIRQAHDLQPVGSLRPDSGLHPVGVDNPFYALDFRQSSLIQNPQAGCLASTFDIKNELSLIHILARRASEWRNILHRMGLSSHSHTGRSVWLVPKRWNKRKEEKSPLAISSISWCFCNSPGWSPAETNRSILVGSIRRTICHFLAIVCYCLEISKRKVLCVSDIYFYLMVWFLVCIRIDHVYHRWLDLTNRHTQGRIGQFRYALRAPLHAYLWRYTEKWMNISHGDTKTRRFHHAAYRLRVSATPCENNQWKGSCMNSDYNHPKLFKWTPWK